MNNLDSSHTLGRFAGDVVELGDDHRVQCPADVRRLVPWITQRTSAGVCAELFAEEHIRVWPLDELAERLSTLRAALEGSIDADIKGAVLADRYREISKQADGRLRLTEAVLLYLGIRPGDKPYVYVQGSDQSPAVDIMSLTRRNALLIQYRRETTA